MHFWWYTDWYDSNAYRAHQPRAGLGDHAQPEGPSSPAEVAARSRDEQLLRAVGGALFDDAEVTGGQMHLSVQNGVVILEGEVDTPLTRAAAVAAAWSVTGVADVCNVLAVTERKYGRS